MVIVDETPDSKVSPRPAPATTNGGQASVPPPPAYSPVDTEANYSTPLRYPYDIPADRPRFPTGKNARRRFIRAFLVALLVWALLAMLTESIVDLAQGAINRRHGITPVPEKPVEPTPLPPPKDDTPVGTDNEYVCLHGSDTVRIRQQRQKIDQLLGVNDTFFITADPPPFSASISYTFPLSSELLFFSNQGNLSYGTFNVNTSADLLPDATEGVVDITVSYYKQEAVDKSRICYFRNGTESAGVNIITPDTNESGDMKFSDMLRYDIAVKLPQRNPAITKPLQLDKFHANFTLFRSDIGDLTHHVHFRDLVIRGELLPITVESAYMSTGQLQTTHAHVAGKFEVEESLALITMNQPISATVTLHNADENHPTRLNMSTSNSALEASIVLSSTPPPLSSNTSSFQQLGGAFNISAVTYNAPSSVLITSQPPDSQLDLVVATANAPAAVLLHPAYEGTFRVSTTLLQPRIEISRTPEDPKGEGRVRDVVFNKLKGKEIMGRVWWGEEDQKEEEDEGETYEEQMEKQTKEGEKQRAVVWEVEHPIEMQRTRKVRGSVQLVSSIMPAVLKL